MKYMLDIAMIVGLLWIGYLWNGEKQNGLALDDEIQKFKANVAQLELDLRQAQNEGAKTASDLEAVKAQAEQLGKDLQDKTDALSAKTAEASELREVGLKLKARVDELEGYKNGARKAIVAEMPKPIPSAP
jgi:F0F1-type ATP synthase membrane subunit b/b'